MLSTNLQALRAKPEATLLGVFFVGATWMFMLMVLGLIGELVLAPWDVVSDAYRPALGTWERTLNDFFEQGGAGLILLIVYGGQLGFIALSLRRFKSGMVIPYFALLNVGFIGLCVLIILSPFAPATPRNMEDILKINYAQTMPGMIAFFIGVAAFLLVQYRLATRGARALVSG